MESGRLDPSELSIGDSFYEETFNGVYKEWTCATDPAFNHNSWQFNAFNRDTETTKSFNVRNGDYPVGNDLYTKRHYDLVISTKWLIAEFWEPTEPGKFPYYSSNLETFNDSWGDCDEYIRGSLNPQADPPGWRVTYHKYPHSENWVPGGSVILKWEKYKTPNGISVFVPAFETPTGPSHVISDELLNEITKEGNLYSFL